MHHIRDHIVSLAAHHDAIAMELGDHGPQFLDPANRQRGPLPGFVDRCLGQGHFTLSLETRAQPVLHVHIGSKGEVLLAPREHSIAIDPVLACEHVALCLNGVKERLVCCELVRSLLFPEFAPLLLKLLVAQRRQVQLLSILVGVEEAHLMLEQHPLHFALVVDPHLLPKLVFCDHEFLLTSGSLPVCHHLFDLVAAKLLV
mmetsp:Transcript_6098/g.19719  ORF Transcript_6098/g.19719 Transcript_6098/m.19719 type:complete len:201 (-) Transcript_6098:34-636(-)